MARESMLPQTGGENLFQGIKRICTEAEAEGIKLFRLSIGQPTGAALLVARQATSEAVMSAAESMHEYQDNGSPGVQDFAEKFCQFHNTVNLAKAEGIAFLPIPGIKPMLGLIPMACNGMDEAIFVQTMTSPGYPNPATWCDYLGLQNESLFLESSNGFVFHPEANVDISADLLMLNYPHNPSGQTVGADWWHELCAYCESHNIRIFNDAAYAKLAFGESCTLADVAVNFPDLSWAEAYSASKMGCNFTGWRVGAMVGSVDFIGDINTIKGNTDSGFFAPAAVGVLEVAEDHSYAVEKYCRIFQERQEWFCAALEERGMRLAVRPSATFFNLWDLPRKAFGEEVQDAKHFNTMMIEKTGIVGVHFHPYIRYAMVAPVETEEFQEAIEKAFDEAKVEY